MRKLKIPTKLPAPKKQHVFANKPLPAQGGAGSFGKQIRRFKRSPFLSSQQQRTYFTVAEQGKDRLSMTPKPKELGDKTPVVRTSLQTVDEFKEMEKMSDEDFQAYLLQLKAMGESMQFDVDATNPLDLMESAQTGADELGVSLEKVLDGFGMKNLNDPSDDPDTNMQLHTDVGNSFTEAYEQMVKEGMIKDIGQPPLYIFSHNANPKLNAEARKKAMAKAGYSEESVEMLGELVRSYANDSSKKKIDLKTHQSKYTKKPEPQL